ncbi:MAG TPA: PDZ domain-containing protein [Armatimonadaceae bacterium]|nr:PDZ domain-containing protein [Armatimonadaceae bacterium]
MLLNRARFLAALFTLLLLPAPEAAAAPPARVAYTVAVTDTAAKTYRVTARAEGVTEQSVSFAIPAWTPGWYVVTQAQKNISNVSAAAGPSSAPLTVEQADPRTWRVASNGAKTVSLSYDLKASDQNYGFFEPYLDRTNGFLPGAAALVYVVGGTSAPCSVTYRLPDGWKIATGNDPTDRPDTFTAPDYDTLIDHPADVGAFQRYDRTINGVPFSVVLVGAEDVPHEGWVEDVFKISAAGMKVFGGAPFPRYVYQFRLLRRSGFMAGLEHLNSTVISLPQAAVRTRNGSALALTAHEFVHAWNVKRIRPAALGPFDYAKEVRVKDLWWMEGVTDYYAPRLVVEAGLRGRGFWLSYMADQITSLQNNAARSRVTLEEASLNVWEGGDSEGVGGLSYYNKGLVVGLLIDLEMRRRTENRVGLDDLMKALLAQVTKTGKGLSDGEIERTASRLAGSDMKPFFERALRSKEELSYEEPVTAAGLKLARRGTDLPYLGVEWDFAAIRADRAPIAGVEPDSPAARVGLRKGDTVTAIDGLPIEGIFGAYLANKRPGSPVVLSVRRAGEEKVSRVPLTLGSREQGSYALEEIASPTPRQAAILAAVTGTTRPGGGSAEVEE